MRSWLFQIQIKTLLIISFAILLSACGGSDGDILSSTQSTAKLPETIDIKLASNADLSVPLTFSSSAASLSGLKFVWNFGDGSTSTEAAPKHTYAKAGDYEVSLFVSDDTGKSKEAKSKVAINNLAGVRGLVCSGADDTGWCWQAPRPSGNRINSFAFTNANTGWRVGAAGDIFRTLDAGKTWVRQQSGVNTDLYEVKFFDDKIGWILGSNQTLLHTADGGVSWKRMVSPIADGASAFAVDNNITVISATNLLLETYTTKYFSTDSGQSWQAAEISDTVSTGLGIVYGIRGSSLFKSTSNYAYPNEVLSLKDQGGQTVTKARIAVAGENIIIVRGRTPDVTVGNSTQHGNPMAWRSEDAGIRWTIFTASGLPVGSENSKLFSLDKEGKVWFTQYAGHTYRTEDGGLNWSEQLGHPYGMVDEPEGLEVVQIAGSRVFALFNFYGTYQVSDDLGKTWADVSQPRLSYQTGQLRLSGGLLLLGNRFDGGYISTDKGNTWSQVIPKSDWLNYQSMIHSVAFTNAKHGIAINSQGQMQVSNDGGQTWKLNRSDLPTIYGRSMLLQFVDPMTVYMLGQDQRLQKSLDGGETWIVNNSVPFSDFGFSDEKNGWARINLTDFRFLITIDGGNNWSPLVMPNRDYLSANSMRIDATNTMTLVGDAGLITQGHDARKPLLEWTWQRRYTGINKNLNKVYSLDNKIYWALGEAATVLRSDDAGVTWKQVAVPGTVDFNDIQFADSKNGWIIGNQGYVLVTQDGGANWKPQLSGSKENLRKIQFVDTKTGWIVGDNGTLLATGTGGH